MIGMENLFQSRQTRKVSYLCCVGQPANLMALFSQPATLTDFDS